MARRRSSNVATILHMQQLESIWNNIMVIIFRHSALVVSSLHCAAASAAVASSASAAALVAAAAAEAANVVAAQLLIPQLHTLTSIHPTFAHCEVCWLKCSNVHLQDSATHRTPLE